MHTKRIGIIAGMVIASAIGALYLAQYGTQDVTADTYAISPEKVFSQLQNDEPVFLVDVRDEGQYNAGHVTGSAHDNFADSDTLEKRVSTIQKRLPEIASKYSLVLVDENGNTKAKQAAQTITEMGIQSFYLEGGINQISDNLTSSSQDTITPKELAQKIAANEDLYLLDVREPDELLDSKIDGAVNIPLAQVFEPHKLDEIPKDKQVIVICGSGNRATIATYELAQHGIDYHVLEGGMKAWNSNTL